MNLKPQLTSIFIAFGSILFVSAVHSDELSMHFSRKLQLNKKINLPSKDIETHVFRVKFPKGFKTPLHTHEGPGPRYVLNGKLLVEDSAERKTYSTGEVFWETGSEMSIENVGDTEAEIIIFEMVPQK